jgi:FkbM family methyltransferase
MPLHPLPNGLVLEAPSAHEARILYREVFEDNGYLRHGVTVRDGDTILDVGANVGAFSAALAQAHRDLRLLLFEPIPATFELLERNARRLLGGARVTLVNAGLGAAPGRVVFELDPWSSFEASAAFASRAAAGRGDADLLARTRAALADGARAGMLRPRIGRLLMAALDHRASRAVVLGAVRAGGRGMDVVRRRRSVRVECAVTTVSAVLREHALDAVDLVKIDVEGAEWEVLLGIDEQDWPRLRQLVLEVHDVDGRAQRVRALLERHGYRVTVEAADWETMRLRGLCNVFATRP